MKTVDFLIEIGTEELPPKVLHKLAAAFEQNLTAGLRAVELSFNQSEVFSSPRRLAVRINALADMQPEQTIERKGPSVKAAYDADGQPTKAMQGFLNATGADIADIETIETPKGQWLFFKKTEPGQAATALLPEIIESALKNLPIPKMMRWGNHSSHFVRPVKWLCTCFDSQIMPFGAFGLSASNQTHGHRFHAPEAITLSHASDYETALEKAYVIAQFEKRRDTIRQQCENLVKPLNAKVQIDPALLDEVTNIVEWPTALLCQFDSRFLDVPQEALISAMQGHQKSFPVLDQSGKLMPYFITISNIESRDPNSVIRGNEKVMHARLSDAEFFYQTDLKQPLEALLPQLDKITFQAKLGSLGEKSRRIASLSSFIAAALNSDIDQAETAGLLAKADLVSDMVGEFPELQGIMGQYYANAHQHPQAIGQAIIDHYKPRFSGDEIPESPISCAVALADKLDTLVGIFGINQKPTGSKDPYALRRTAIGILRILIENQLALDLHTLLTQASLQYGDKLSNQRVVDETLAFCLERLKVWLKEQGTKTSIIQAVEAVKPTQPLDFAARVNVVEAFVQLPEAKNLTEANKRVSNILQKNSKDLNINTVTESQLVEPAEKALYEAVETLTNPLQQLLEQHHYTEALTQLATLQAPLDAFFTDVMVMADDSSLRANRLALLQQLQQVLSGVADIGQL